MTKKLTQEEAKQQIAHTNIELISKYIDSRTELIFKCHCGNTFESLLSSVRNNLTQSCGCKRKKRGYLQRISQAEAERRSLLVGVKLIDTYVGRNTLINFICPFCSKKFKARPKSIWTKEIKSCGCYMVMLGKQRALSQKEASIRFNKRGFKLLDKYLNGSTRVKTRCVCGAIFFPYPDSIFYGRRLNCDKCGTHKNGILTSLPVYKLHKLINNYGVHNYKTKLGYCVDIAIALNRTKIAIEYDEWYWHKNKKEQDNKRLKQLRKNGWKTLQIKAHNNLPEQWQLYQAIYDLAYTKAKQRTIRLSGWGKKLKHYGC